jgi:hypothetical protein
MLAVGTGYVVVGASSLATSALAEVTPADDEPPLADDADDPPDELAEEEHPAANADTARAATIGASHRLTAVFIEIFSIPIKMEPSLAP